MEMESTRRPFNRSISKELGLKKPRLTEEPAAPNRASNGRGGFIQQPAISNSGVGGGLRLQRERDSGSSDSVRVPSQQQLPAQKQLLYQELVDQYKTALAELTFNSKPIITNLTIIAGENVHAAKAIAATVCTNILEVSSEQKLPSLYLLDSIVKNIGRDYIKYFALRLPEVFCKVYKQVDPSVHQGMRHLFGTWKGVFPSQTLQMIAEELEFSISSVNGSSSGTSRTDSQVQRSAHSIHVNPKYLEARQRLQTTTDVESLEGHTSISSGRSWSDPSAKHQDRDQLSVPLREKNSRLANVVSEYSSSVSGRPGLEMGIMNEKFKERGFDRPWYESGNDITGRISILKNGFDRKPKQNFVSRSTEGMGKSWHNSEEEEYMWDEMNSRPADHTLADASAKDNWTPDNYQRLDIHSHIRRPDTMHGIGSGIDEEIPADSMSIKPRQVASGTQVWSQELQPLEKRMLSAPGRNISGPHSEGYSTGLKNYMYPTGRTLPAHSGGPSSTFSTNVMPGPKVSMPSSTPSLMHQHPPSPSFSAQDPMLHNNFADRYQTSVGPPSDPRKPRGLRSRNPNDQSSPNVHTSSAAMPPLQQRKLVPPTRHIKLEVPEFESSGDEDLFPSQVSISENLPTTGNSSPEKPNLLTVDDSPRQSITSSLLDAVLNNGTLGGSSLIHSSSLGGVLPSFQSGPSTTLASSLAGIGTKYTQAAVHSDSNPVSSLLSSLMAKGLITSSKSDLPSSASNQKPDQPPDRSPGVASTSSTPASSVPLTIAKPLPFIKDEPSSFNPIAKASQGSPKSTIKIKDLIGFEFKPSIVRNFHPEVVSDLFSDPPHQCDICGLGLKLQEQLDKHMEWHSLKAHHEHDPPNTVSRRWYSNLVEWVDQFHHIHSPSSLLGESEEETEKCEQMVPADESQCACILCGELFEDLYSQERNEWMFKGAVYHIASEELQKSGAKSDTANLRPIVHANCITEDSIRDLGLASDVKLEKDV